MGNSFYGGEQGYSWLITHNFPTYDEMVADFQNQTGIVNKGEFCVVSLKQPDERDDHEGCIYRHGFSNEPVFVMKIPRGYSIKSITAITENGAIKDISVYEGQGAQIPVIGQLAKRTVTSQSNESIDFLYVCIYQGGTGQAFPSDTEGTSFGLYKYSSSSYVWECLGQLQNYPDTIKIEWDAPEGATNSIELATNQYEFIDVLGKRYTKQAGVHDRLTLSTVNTLVTIEKENDIVYALYSHPTGLDLVYRPYTYKQPKDGRECVFTSLQWKNLGINGYTYRVFNVFGTKSELESSGPPSESGWLAYVSNDSSSTNNGFYVYRTTSPQGWVQVNSPDEIKQVGIGSEIGQVANGGIWFKTETNPNRVKTLHPFLSESFSTIPIGTDGQYIDMASGLNLEQELKIGGNEKITIAQHNQIERAGQHRDWYSNIDENIEIPAHTAILEKYANSYNVHSMMFYKIKNDQDEMVYPSFLSYYNVIGYIRMFDGNIQDANNLVKVKYIYLDQEDNAIKIEQEVQGA